MVYQGSFLLGNENHRKSHANCLPNYRSEVIYFRNGEVKSRSLCLIFMYSILQVSFLVATHVNLKLSCSQPFICSGFILCLYSLGSHFVFSKILNKEGTSIAGFLLETLLLDFTLQWLSYRAVSVVLATAVFVSNTILCVVSASAARAQTEQQPVRELVL